MFENEKALDFILGSGDHSDVTNRRQCISRYAIVSAAMLAAASAASGGCESNDAASPGSPSLAPNAPTAGSELPVVECEPVTEVQLGQHTYAAEDPSGQIAQYLLFLPQSYASREKWPLILFLHGSGESGDLMERVSRHGPPKYVRTHPDFPFVVLAPQNRTTDWWSVSEVATLLSATLCRYKVDEERVYLTGLSLGGYATWSIAVEYPNAFAALAPVSAGSHTSEICSVKHLPVWGFHGADDGAVPLSEAQAVVDAFRACGGSMEFTVYPDRPHVIWSDVYDGPELYDWFRQWTRQPPAQP